MNYQLIVFDWDGTLMDSESRIVECLSSTASELGLQGKTRHELKNVIGLALNDAIRHLFPDISSVQLTNFVDRYRYHYLSDHHASSSLFENTRSTLEQLSQQGYLMAVATGKGRRGLDRSMAETNVSSFFITSRCADESFSKPNPQMLLDILDYTGIEPDQALMVGDTEYDLLMAENAGTDSLAVSYGVHEKDRLLACNPLGCLDDISDIISWLRI